MKSTLTTLLLVILIQLNFSQNFKNFGNEFIFPNLGVRGLNIETGSLPAAILIQDMGTLSIQTINLQADTAVELALLMNTNPNYSRFYHRNLIAQLASTRIVSSTGPIAVRYRTADGAGGGMSSLLPVKELGYDYTVSTHQIEYPVFPHSMLSHIVITATENNTAITIIPTHNTDNGWLAGSINTINLNRGESFPIQGIDCGVFASPTRPACFPTLQNSLNNLSGTRIFLILVKKLK